MTKIAAAPPPGSLAGLGRLPAPSDKDLNYLLPKRRLSSLVTKAYWTARPPVLDQGGTSQCVIYAGDKWLTAFPVSNPGFLTAEERTRVYKEVQRRDEWAGEDYDGTSVRAMFKYLKERGLVSEYRWGFDIETCLTHLLTLGPMEMGTDWHLDMFTPDEDGYIWPTGEVVGGHAWVAIGANRNKRNPDGTRGAVRKLGSWGSRWGPHKGRAWVSFDAFDKLLRNYGEAAVAAEVRVA